MDKNAFRKLSYGVYIISAWDNGRAIGCTANSAMQITSSPATIAVSINHDNYTNHVIKESGFFAISILSEKSDSSLIGRFGFQSSKDNNKFDGIEQEVFAFQPVIKDASSNIVLKVIDSMETSSHTVFLGEVVDAKVNNNETPMTYAYYHNVIKGQSPKNAPTYIAPEETTGKYTCSVCNYVYDGETPFEELPDTWVCPICGKPKSVFKKS